MAVSTQSPISVLAIGQSNMLGKYGPTQHKEVDRVRVWLAGGWRPAVLGEAPFQRDRATNGIANNLAFVFAKKLAESCQRDVRLVLLASDGKRIEFFLPNTVLSKNGWENRQHSSHFGKSLSEEIFGANGAAFAALNNLGRSEFDVVLIHQGEANFSPTAEFPWVYKDKVTAMIQEFYRRGLASQFTQFILGHINSRYYFAREHRAALESLVIENVSIVEWEGIEDVGSVEGTGDPHATGNGLETLGERYFSVYSQYLT